MGEQRRITKGLLAITALLILGLLFAIACGSDPTPTPTPTPTPGPTPTPTLTMSEREVGGAVDNIAPEFTGIVNWINSEPLTMEELRGQVVLIDFWTYTCVNCIRTLPYIKDWHAKYADERLVIIGVHTPEFEFEKVTENVIRSAQEFELTYPIAQDNDFRTWRAYSNRAWPAKYLIDAQGVVRYSHIGEGAYQETEEQIRGLLEEIGRDLSAIPVNDTEAPRFDPRAYLSTDPVERITREIYGGFLRNASSSGIYIAHEEYYDEAEVVHDYEDPGVHINQFLYLHGPWENGLESIRHARTTTDFEDYMILRFLATSVNAVFDPAEVGSYEVQVEIDGRPLTEEEAGGDLVVEDDRSYFVVNEPRMYAIVELPEFSNHVLKLSSNSDQFALFAFTFGAYPDGP